MTLPFEVPREIGQSRGNLQREVSAVILRTVKDGWTLALESPHVNAKCLEVALTERLRKGMRDALRYGELQWGKDLVVLSGTESRSSPELEVPDGLVDIAIFSIKVFLCSRHLGAESHEPHAIIECKRITSEDSRLCRQYVREGIDRFRSGKYSSRHLIAFMAGYLISGEATDAVAKINHYLDHAEKLQRSKLDDESWAWQSCHPRSKPPPMELQHALLSFDTTLPHKPKPVRAH